MNKYRENEYPALVISLRQAAGVLPSRWQKRRKERTVPGGTKSKISPFPGRKEGDWSSKVLLRQEKPVIRAAVPSPESATAESAGSRTGKPLPCRPRLGGFLRLPAAVSALRAVLLIRSSLVGEAADNFFNVRTVGDGLVLAESQLRRNAQIERLCQLPADIAGRRRQARA